MPTTTTTPPTIPGVQSSATDPGSPSSATVGPLILATDGSESAEPAFAAATLLAQRCGTDVEVVAVVEPTMFYIPAPYPVSVPMDADATDLEQLRARARQQVRALVGEAPGWSVETHFGAPAPTLRRIARERQAELLITGVSRHGLVDRMFGEETAIHIAQLTETPMLAVTPSMTRLPRTIVVAIDLDSPRVPDTPVLRALFSEATTVYVVNARPQTPPFPDSELWERTYNDGLDEAMRRVKESFGLAPKVFRQLVPLSGNPAREILSFATYAKADLIVLGQRRRWMLHRRLGGGIPTRVLRATTCSVLVLPRAREPIGLPMSKPVGRGQRTETITQRHQWSPRLAELTRRNSGRRVMLEIDDVELGVQAQVMEYPFIGMTYDHRDDRMEIMLGERSGRGAHLTHSVAAPASLDILESLDGRAMAIRVANEQGQALMTFVL